MIIRVCLAFFVALFFVPLLNATAPDNAYCLRRLKTWPHHLVMSGDLATALVQPAISYIHASTAVKIKNDSNPNLLTRVLRLGPEIQRKEIEIEKAEHERLAIDKTKVELIAKAEAHCAQLRSELQALQNELAHLADNAPLEAIPHPTNRQVITGGDPLVAFEFLPGELNEKNPYTFALDTKRFEIHENEGERPGYWMESVETEGGEIEALFKAAMLYGMGEFSEVGPIVSFHGIRQLKIELNNPEFPELEAGQSYEAEFRVSQHNEDIYTLEIVIYLPESLH